MKDDQTEPTAQVEPAGHPYVSPDLDGEVRTPASVAPAGDDLELPPEPDPLKAWREREPKGNAILRHIDALLSLARKLKERLAEAEGRVTKVQAQAFDKIMAAEIKLAEAEAAQGEKKAKA